MDKINCIHKYYCTVHNYNKNNRFVSTVSNDCITQNKNKTNIIFLIGKGDGKNGESCAAIVSSQLPTYFRVR